MACGAIDPRTAGVAEEATALSGVLATWTPPKKTKLTARRPRARIATRPNQRRRERRSGASLAIAKAARRESVRPARREIWSSVVESVPSEGRNIGAGTEGRASSPSTVVSNGRSAADSDETSENRSAASNAKAR
jgi:hypothetical protein